MLSKLNSSLSSSKFLAGLCCGTSVLLIGSGSAQAASVSFSGFPNITTPSLSFADSGLEVTGSNDLFLGQSEVVDNFDPDFPFTLIETDGLGVVGGNIGTALASDDISADSNAFVDSGEFVDFMFTNPASDIVLNIGFGSIFDLDDSFNAFPPDPFVEAFGAGGASLGIESVNDDIFSLSSAFSDQPISSFQFGTEANGSAVITGLSFEEAQPVPTPAMLPALLAFGLRVASRRKQAQTT